jgi:hypothetical protein
MIGSFMRRLAVVVTLCIFSVCIPDPCLANMNNGACAKIASLKDRVLTLLNLGSDAASGQELVSRGMTFAKLAAFEDFSKVDVDHQVYVEPGTRYFLYDDGYAGFVPQYEARTLQRLRLVLLENGLCAYLTDADVKKHSESLEVAQKIAGTDSAAYIMDFHPTFYCEDGNPAEVGPGELYGVSSKELSQDDKVVIKFSKENTPAKCDLSIPKDLVNVVDLKEIKQWDKMESLHGAATNGLTKISKPCRVDQINIDELKAKMNASATITIPLWFVQLKFGPEVSKEFDWTSKLILDKNIDFQKRLYVDATSSPFYFTVITHCLDDTSRADQRDFQLDRDGKPTSIWDSSKVTEAAAGSKDSAKYVNLANPTLQPYVTCPAQHNAIMEVLQHNFGWSNADAQFAVSQISLWKGGPQRNGLVCK